MSNIGAIVGGSSAAGFNCPFYDSDQISASDNQGGNGAATDTLITTSVDITLILGSKIRITETGAFTNTLQGQYGYFVFSSIYSSGFYEVLAVDASGNYIDIDVTYISDSTQNVTCYIGGAVPALGGAGTPGDFALQDIFDSSLGSAAANNVYVYCYDDGGIVPTTEFTKSTGAGTGEYRFFFIGADSAYAELAVGSYATFDTGGVDINTDIFDVSVKNVTFKNIAAIDPSGASIPGGSEVCFRMDTLNVIENCYAEGGYYGIYLNGPGGSAINCSVFGSRIYGICANNHGCISIGCLVKDGPTYSTTGIYCNGIGASVVDCIIDGAAIGVRVGPTNQLVANNTFVNISTSCVVTRTSVVTVLIYNNIMHVTTPATGLAIDFATGGSWYERNNITNVTVAANTGFYSDSSIDSLTFTNTDPLTNITSFNYKPNRGQTLADANVIEKGFAPYFNSATTNGKASIGAFGTYDLPEKPNVVAADTVYGITGTNAGGGGGGLLTHPSMSGGMRG